LTISPQVASGRYTYQRTVRLNHFDKDGFHRLASASTRCKTCVSNARLTLFPDFQRTCPGHSAQAFQSVCAQIIQSRRSPVSPSTQLERLAMCFRGKYTSTTFCDWQGAVSRRWL